MLHNKVSPDSFGARILSIACVAGAITYIAPTVTLTSATCQKVRLKTERADGGQTDVILAPVFLKVILHEIFKTFKTWLATTVAFQK